MDAKAVPEIEPLAPAQPIANVSTTVAQPAAVPGPPLPPTGLPEGWTMEQWNHYGHQYLQNSK